MKTHLQYFYQWEQQTPDAPFLKQPSGPGFNESYHGYKSFNGLLEDAQVRGFLSLERDEKSGGYIVRAPGA